MTDFRFGIPPADFCFSLDFGVIHTFEALKKALNCINHHLRDGGGLVIETSLPPIESHSWPLETYMPMKQIYPGRKVWKTGSGHIDAETDRHYISQTFYSEDENGHIESFDHSFYMQSYSRSEWLAAFRDCGFTIVGEYNSRKVESWQSGGDTFRIFETVRAGVV